MEIIIIIMNMIVIMIIVIVVITIILKETENRNRYLFEPTQFSYPKNIKIKMENFLLRTPLVTLLDPAFGPGKPLIEMELFCCILGNASEVFHVF